MKTLQIIDKAQTSEALELSPLIDALREGFSAGCDAPPRHHHTIGNSEEPDATLLLMPAWEAVDTPGRLLGVKLVTVYPGNADRNMPGLTSSYLLYDGSTGEQIALLDGDVITIRRTVATAALGACFLSRPDARTLLLFGSGRVASLVPDAMRQVRDVERVLVWDMHGPGAVKLVDELGNKGFEASVVEDIEAAVAEADIISAATLATRPLIRGEWVQPGTHVDLIGSFTPGMREADDRLISRSRLYIDTCDALSETGDLIQPMKAGAIHEGHIKGTLADLCRGTINGRESDADVTVFKAVGSSLADLVAARLVHRSLKELK